MGAPKEYMISHGLFIPHKNADYQLCRFYEVGSKSSSPHFPMPQKLVTCSQLLHFLKKGQKANRTYLLVTITPSSLLGELQALGSLHWLSMRVKGDLLEKHHTNSITVHFACTRVPMTSPS